MVLAGPVLERSELFARRRRDGEAVFQGHITQAEGAGQRRVGQAGEQAVQFLLDAVAPGLRLFVGSQRADARGDLGGQFLGLLDEHHRLHRLLSLSHGILDVEDP